MGDVIHKDGRGIERTFRLEKLQMRGCATMGSLSRPTIRAELDSGALFYRACGLSYVYLADGYKLANTPYGSGVSIEEVQSLHAAIAGHVVLRRKKLDAAGFRFLRYEMGFTQERVAAAFGVTVQTIARYEKGQTDVSGPADRLMRILYVMTAVPQEDRLNWMDQIYLAMVRNSGEEGLVVFTRSPQGWIEAGTNRSEEWGRQILAQGHH